MLRIGKKDQEDHEHSTDKPDISAYSTPKTYSSYQGTTTEAKPSADSSPPSLKALTESEALARDIKEGTLGGFVGSGTVVGSNEAFSGQITLWLWFTVLFANFAEAVAEGRGKAQADTLRRTRTETKAKRAATPDDLIRTGADGRIRMIARRATKPRRRTKPV